MMRAIIFISFILVSSSSQAFGPPAGAVYYNSTSENKVIDIYYSDSEKRLNVLIPAQKRVDLGRPHKKILNIIMRIKDKIIIASPEDIDRSKEVDAVDQYWVIDDNAICFRNLKDEWFKLRGCGESIK